jgi:transcriptional regulator with GAF, ATPase, and Fis domain
LGYKVPTGQGRYAAVPAEHVEPVRLQESATISPRQTVSVPATQKQWLESQRVDMNAALAKTGGRIYGKGGAAELLGLRPTTLSSRIAALGIKRKAD